MHFGLSAKPSAKLLLLTDTRSQSIKKHAKKAFFARKKVIFAKTYIKNGDREIWPCNLDN